MNYFCCQYLFSDFFIELMFPEKTDFIADPDSAHLLKERKTVLCALLLRSFKDKSALVFILKM